MFLKRPQHLLLITGCILGVFSFLLPDGASLDFHTHDGYLVIAQSHIYLALAVLSIIIWVLYLLVNPILFSTKLSWVHVIFTMFTLLLFTLTLYIQLPIRNDTTPHRYIDYSHRNQWELLPDYAKTLALGIFVLLSGQILFVINLAGGIVSLMIKRFPKS